MAKIVVFDTVARERLKKGVDALANAVKKLLGSCFAEAVAEAFDAATHVVHRLLSAGVEGV